MAKKTVVTEEHKGKTDYNVSAEEFISAWEMGVQKGWVAQQIADHLGLPKPILLARACNYRKLGIKLSKVSKRLPSTLDVDNLNRLINHLNKPGMKQFETHIPIAGDRKPQELPQNTKKAADAK